MFDAIIIGAGVIGSAIARALSVKNPSWKIAVLEKEPQPALHTSGRNSGVLHAGFNQKPGTLKAKLCVEGNRRAREYCLKNKVPMKEVGTLVAALEDKEISVLEELLRRGQANGVSDLRIIDSQKLRALEPNARGLAALHAPTGAIVESRAFVGALAREAQANGVEFFFNQKVEAIEETPSGYKIFSKIDPRLPPKADPCPSLRRAPLADTTHDSRFLINAAGLYADKIAHMIDVGREYLIVPFRGQYCKIRPEKSSIINSMIYPIPNLKYPFLGVHWTKKIDGSVAIGPNAVIAFGRESYGFYDINWVETLSMLKAPFFNMIIQKEFRQLAWRQLEISLSKRAFLKEASLLVEGATPRDLLPGTAGNRAQLINNKGELVDDLVVKQKGHSWHVLNAVSPGFTSALPFADFIVEQLGA